MHLWARPCQRQYFPWHHTSTIQISPWSIFILPRTQQCQFLQPLWERRTRLCHISLVLGLFIFWLPSQASETGQKKMMWDFGAHKNIWNRHFWSVAIASEERGDLRFWYLLTSLRMFWAFHPILQACHLIRALSSLYSPVRTRQPLLRQLIMTWRFPHSSQFRELGYLWIPE